MYDILHTLGSANREQVRNRYPNQVSHYNPEFPGRNVAIFGSFNPENWKRIVAVRARFRELGFHVLVPLGDLVPGSPDDFVLLDADQAKIQQIEAIEGRKLHPDEAARILELLFQIALQDADFAYLVPDERPGIDDGGYMGLSAATEFGLLLGSKPIAASAPLSPTLDARDGYGSMFDAYVSGLLVTAPDQIDAHLRAGGSLAFRGFDTFFQGALA